MVPFYSHGPTLEKPVRLKPLSDGFDITHV